MGGKKNKKGKVKSTTLSLGDFLGESNAVGPDSQVVTARYEFGGDEDSQDRFVSSEKIVLPSCPRTSRGPAVDDSMIPTSPPFVCHVGNLPFDSSETELKSFFRGLNIVNVKLPTTDDGTRFKGYGYVEFETREELKQAYALNEENLRNRKIRVSVPDADNDGKNDFGGRRNRGGWGDREREDRSQGVSDWRAAPPDRREGGGGGRFGGGGGRYDDDRRGGGGFGGGSSAANEDDAWRKKPSGFEDRRGGGGGGFEDRRGGGFDDRRGGGGGFDDRRGGGGGFDDRRGGGGFEDRRRGYDDRRGGFDDRRGGYEDRRGGGGGFERRDDRSFERRDAGSYSRYGSDEPAKERPRLNLKPRSVPVSDAPNEPAAEEGAKASIFGDAKPVNTAAKEKEIEQKFKKEPAPPPAKASSSDIFGAAKPVDTLAREREIEEKLKKSPNLVKKESAPSKPSASDIFGAAKPVDTLAREREIEEKLKKQVPDIPSKPDTWRDQDSRPRRVEGDRPRDGGFRQRGDGPLRGGASNARVIADKPEKKAAPKRDRDVRTPTDNHPNGVDDAEDGTSDYDSDEERFKKAQPKGAEKAVNLDMSNKFGDLDLEQEI